MRTSPILYAVAASFLAPSVMAQGMGQLPPGGVNVINTPGGTVENDNASPGTLRTNGSAGASRTGTVRTNGSAGASTTGTSRTRGSAGA